MKPVGVLGRDPHAVVVDDCEEIALRLGGAAERFAGKSVLITGAAGMLAAYLADVLAHLNDTGRVSSPVALRLVVRSLDANEGRLRHLRDRDDVRFIVADAATPFDVEGPVDMVVHAASAASPDAYRADPLGTLAVNGVGTRHVLDLARERGAESLLFVSSSEVYGTPDGANIPTPESYVGATPWLGGRACYVEGKRYGEALCAAAAEQHGTPVKIVRPFHFHGPGLRLSDGRIVAALVSMGLRGEPIALKSDGRATRTYGYVVDAAHAFLSVLLSDQNGEAFNVGAQEPETSILELATIVVRLFGRRDAVRLNTEVAPAHLRDAPQRVRPDLRKLRERLGVVPSVPLEVGLARTIHWHQARLALAGTA